MWVQSLGAITSRVLQPGEQWIGACVPTFRIHPQYFRHTITVDNGHLVAWTAQYKVERINAGGLFSAAHTDEGLVCRCAFTLPRRRSFDARADTDRALGSPVLELYTSSQGTPKRSESGSPGRYPPGRPLDGI